MLGQLPWLQVCWMGAFFLEQMPQIPTYSEVNLLCCLASELNTLGSVHGHPLA